MEFDAEPRSGNAIISFVGHSLLEQFGPQCLLHLAHQTKPSVNHISASFANQLIRPICFFFFSRRIFDNDKKQSLGLAYGLAYKINELYGYCAIFAMGTTGKIACSL